MNSIFCYNLIKLNFVKKNRWDSDFKIFKLSNNNHRLHFYPSVFISKLFKHMYIRTIIKLAIAIFCDVVYVLPTAKQVVRYIEVLKNNCYTTRFSTRLQTFIPLTGSSIKYLISLE